MKPILPSIAAAVVAFLEAHQSAPEPRAPNTTTLAEGDALEVRQALLASVSALQLSAPRVRNELVERSIRDAIEKAHAALLVLP